MHILFVALPPTPEIEAYLKAEGFSWTTVRTPHNVEDTASTRFDVVVLHASLGDFENLRQRMSDAIDWRFVAMVLPESGAATVTPPADFPVQAIWPERFWAFNFRRTVDRLLAERGLVAELEGLREDMHSLQALHERLGATTQTLVGRLQKDIDSARSLQRSILKPPGNGVPGVELLVKYVAAPGRGGDYYDVFDLERRKLGLLVVDAPRHAHLATILDALVPLDPKHAGEILGAPQALVSHLIDRLGQEFAGKLDGLSLWYAVLDRATLKMRIFSHGAIVPLVWRGQGLHAITAENPGEFIFDLQPGDRMVVVTDGVKQIWEDWAGPLAGLLRERGAEMRELQNEFLAAVEAAKERTAFADDVTLVQLQVDSRALYSLK